MKILVIPFMLCIALVAFASHAEFALIADVDGNLHSIALDGSFEVRKLGKYSNDGGNFFNFLTLRPGTNRLYGFRRSSELLPDGTYKSLTRVHYVELDTGVLREIEDSRLRSGGGEFTAFSPDGRYLLTRGDYEENEGGVGTLIVDAENWALKHDFEKLLLNPVFSADSSTVFHFDDDGIRAFDLSDGSESLYCAVPGARSAIICLDLLLDESRMLFFSAENTLQLPYFGYRVNVVEDGEYQSILSLDSVSGRAIANNAIDGPYWFYDHEPGVRFRVIKSTAEWVETERDPAYPPGSPVVFRVNPENGEVSSFGATGKNLLPFNEESELNLTREQAKWGFGSEVIYASPSGRYLLFLYHLGYRHVGKVLIYDTRAEKFVGARKLGTGGLTNVVFVEDSPPRIRYK